MKKNERTRQVTDFPHQNQVERFSIPPMTALAWFTFASYFSAGVFSPLFAVFLKDLGWSGSLIGFLFSLRSVLTFAMIPLWGIIADKTQKHKWMLGISVSGVMSCLLLITTTTSVSEIFFFSVLMFVFTSMESPIMEGISLSSNNYGKIKSFAPLGLAIGACITGWVVTAMGQVSIFYLSALATLLCLPVIFFIPISGSKRKHAGQSVRLLFRRETIWFWLTLVLLAGPLQTFQSVFGILFQGAGGSVLGISLSTTLGYLLQVFVMRWLNRFLRLGDKFIYLVILVVGIRWFAIYLFPSMPVLYFACFCQAFGIGLLIPYFKMELSKITPEGMQSSAIGVMYSITAIATAGCNFLSGIAMDVTGVYSCSLLLGVITFIGLITQSICTKR